MSDATEVQSSPSGDADSSGRAASSALPILGLVFGAAGFVLALLAVIGVVMMASEVDELDDDVEMHQQHMDDHAGMMGEMHGGMGGEMPGGMAPGNGMGQDHGREQMPGGGGMGDMGEMPGMDGDMELPDDLTAAQADAMRERIEGARERLDAFEERLDAAVDGIDESPTTTAPAG